MIAIQARKPWALIGLLMYIETIAAFEVAMIYGAIGLLYKLFGDPVLVGWVITIYLLVSACLTPLIARLGDLYGRKLAVSCVLAVATVGSLVSAMSPDLMGLLIGRGLQGFAGSLLPLCFGLLREHLEPSKQRIGTGMIAATASIASGVGTLAGGLIVDHLPWHSMFWFASVASFIAVLLSIFSLPPSRPAATPDRRIDLIGGTLTVPMIALVIYAIGQIKYWGFGDPRIWSMIGIAVLIGAYWFRHEWKRPEPLIDVRLLGNRQVLIANAVMIMAAYGVFQVGPFISMLLQQTPKAGIGFGLSPTLSGAFLFGAQVTALIGGPIAGRIADRAGPRRALQIGAFIAAVGWTGMYMGQHWLELLVVMLFVQGIGSVMILGATPMVLADAVPLARTSEANGVTAVLRQTNFAIATQLCAFLLSLHTVAVGDAHYPGSTSVGLAFSMLTAATVLGFVVSLMLPRAGRATAPAVHGIPARCS